MPAWESGVHGFGAFVEGSAQNFVFQETGTDIDMTLRWVSIDDKVTVNKIELYVVFNESYTDADGNPATAKHGGDEGVLFQTIEGSEVPGDGEDITISVSQADVYELYQNNTFDYDKDGPEAAISVFNTNPYNPDRSPAQPFVKGDAFQLRWKFYTTDGRVFERWGVSVCTEFPGANCAVNWGVICASDLGGTYTMTSTWTTCTGDTGGGTYNNVPVTATAIAGKYTIPDLSGGMEPEFWGNPNVAATIVDECGTIKLDLASFDYIYGYSILGNSSVNPNTGVITVRWENAYGEFGTNVYTPN